MMGVVPVAVASSDILQKASEEFGARYYVQILRTWYIYVEIFGLVSRYVVENHIGRITAYCMIISLDTLFALIMSFSTWFIRPS